jgi:hypothetical protein
MPRVAEEVKPMVEFLERELTSWPHVTTKPMFGMVGLYRKKKIFAALPRTRALGTKHAILCKLPRDKQTGKPGKGWKTVELFSDRDLREALRLLNRAYEQAVGKE